MPSTMTLPRLQRPQRPRLPLGRRQVLVLLLAAAVLAAVVPVAVLMSQRSGGGATRSVVEVDLRAPSVKPSLPAAARQPTEAGATAFTKFWFDGLNYSLAHGDTDLLAGYTAAGCGQCSGWLIGIARWKAAGSRLEGGLTAPMSLSIGTMSTREPVQFLATFLTTPATLTAKDGKVTRYGGARTAGSVSVLWANGRWQMNDVNVGRPR